MWWKKKPKKPTIWERILSIPKTIPVIAVCMSSLWGGYQFFVAPDFGDFKDNTSVEAVYQGTLLAVFLKTDKVPDMEVSIEYMLDDISIAHHHFADGIPNRKGLKFAEGQEEFIEPIPVTFLIEDSEVTVRFVFHGWQTLFQPKTFVFKGDILQ